MAPCMPAAPQYQPSPNRRSPRPEAPWVLLCLAIPASRFPALPVACLHREATGAAASRQGLLTLQWAGGGRPRPCPLPPLPFPTRSAYGACQTYRAPAGYMPGPRLCTWAIRRALARPSSPGLQVNQCSVTMGLGRWHAMSSALLSLAEVGRMHAAHAYEHMHKQNRTDRRCLPWPAPSKSVSEESLKYSFSTILFQHPPSFPVVIFFK